MSTKAQIVARFLDQGFYPDCPPSEATVLFNDAAKTVLKSLRVRNAEIDISLVAGTRVYSLSTAALGIVEAYYKVGSASDQWYAMKATTLDFLARGETSWRTNATESQPYRFYTTTTVTGNTSSLAIGLDPIPDTTTGGGYPKITVYCTSYVVLADGDETYAGLLTDDAYLFHMSLKWATRQDPGRMEFWNQLYKDTLAEEDMHINGRAEGADNVRILYPYWNQLSNQV